MSKKIIQFAATGIAIIAIIIFSIHTYATQKLSEKLQITTQQGDSIRFHDLSLNLFAANLRLDSVRLYWEVERSEDERSYGLQAQLEQLSLEGIHFFDYLLDGVVRADRLKLTGPEVQVIIREEGASVLTDTAQNSSASSAIPPIHIRHFSLGPTRIAYHRAGQQPILQVDSFALSAESLDYLPENPDSSLMPKMLDWSASGLLYRQTDANDAVQIGHLSGSLRDSTFHIDNLRILPRSPADRPQQRESANKGGVEVQIGGVRFRGFDWQRLLQQRYISAASVGVDELRIEAIEDQAQSKRNRGKRKALYQETFLAMGVPIRLDSIGIENSSVVYELIPASGRERGRLAFTDLYASLYNITNDSARLSSDINTAADIRAMVNEASELQLHFDFDLGTTDHQFSYQGELKSFPITTFNSILSVAAPLRIASGRADKLTFDIRADAQAARGELLFTYDNLRVNWDDDQSMLKTLGQKVFMLESNPNDGELHRGEVYFERVSDRSFWHYFYKNILSGVRSTVLPDLIVPEKLETE